MEREILFRGLDDNGNWRFGSLVDWRKSGGDLEIMDTIHAHKVIPESVGQFTGLTDKNGVKIFEGDVLEYEYYNSLYGLVKIKHIVSFNEYYNDNDGRGDDYVLGWTDQKTNSPIDTKENEYTVISNIHSI